MPSWKWIAASRRGTSHERSGTHRQDAYRCVEARYGRLIATISDGAGSASHGRYGAVLTCRFLTAKATEFGKLPSEMLFKDWIEELRGIIASTASNHDLTMRDFACTMLFAMTNSKQLFIGHIGDGAIVRQHKTNAAWECVSWPETGEYASTTYFVTDHAGVRLRSATLDGVPSGLALFSDGLERLVLDFSNQSAPSGFFNTIAAPLLACNGRGPQRPLSRQLNDYLGSSKINERTDDDKTLIVAAKK